MPRLQPSRTAALLSKEGREHDRTTQAGRRRAQDVRGFAPKLAALTDDVLFEDVWNRPELSARDRSLITVAVLTAGGNTEQLGFHLGRAVENGVTRDELIEAITHITLYAGWPKGMAAMGVAKQLFADNA